MQREAQSFFVITVSWFCFTVHENSSVFFSFFFRHCVGAEQVLGKCLHTSRSDTVLSEVVRESSVVEQESANALYLF